MNRELEQIRRAAKRLERRSTQCREKLWKGDYIGALADLAETGEIGRRLYNATTVILRAKSENEKPREPTVRSQGNLC